MQSIDTTQGQPKDRCIRVTTIHRVKGLEWDFVFIPECDERSPSIESERRLFYVGITRARTRCIVSCGADISVIETRSRFLRDAMEVPKPARLR